MMSSRLKDTIDRFMECAVSPYETEPTTPHFVSFPGQASGIAMKPGDPEKGTRERIFHLLMEFSDPPLADTASDRVDNDAIAGFAVIHFEIYPFVEEYPSNIRFNRLKSCDVLFSRKINSAMSILKLEDVRKAYHKHEAVRGVSFEVPDGSIFGLLGPNGAGKTSLIRIITGITGADQGTVYLGGQQIDSRHPERIGYMPEERGLYKKMKVGEQLLYLARLKGLDLPTAKKEIKYWLERFEIIDWWGKKIEELSKGMQQKIQFISTVVHKPRLLILDEPFSGLDPINTNLIKSEIKRLNEEGVSIIFSTHRMEQVEQICDHIVLINLGKNVLEGEVARIREQFKENVYDIAYTGSLPGNIGEQFRIIDRQEGRLTLQLAEGEDSNDILRLFVNSGIHIRHFEEILPSLNEIFIKQVQTLTHE